MLVQYTSVHFKTEEALMKEAKFPLIEEHILLHKALFEKTKKLTLETNRNKDAERILRFLKEWWLGHINKEDKKYAPFLKKLLASPSSTP